MRSQGGSRGDPEKIIVVKLKLGQRVSRRLDIFTVNKVYDLL